MTPASVTFQARDAFTISPTMKVSDKDCENNVTNYVKKRVILLLWSNLRLATTVNVGPLGRRLLHIGVQQSATIRT
jgi:hypothetical protein